MEDTKIKRYIGWVSFYCPTVNYYNCVGFFFLFIVGVDFLDGVDWPMGMRYLFLKLSVIFIFLQPVYTLTPY